MMFYRNKIIRYVSILILCLGFVPLQGYARIALETEIVSGTITAVRDGAVELDGNGVFYYPGKKVAEMDLSSGSTVTLRYYLDIRDEPVYKYVEFAPGLHSLKPKAPSSKAKSNNIKF